ncbi:MAG: hypothetical protein RKP73_17480 [Candidatus Contendobacter sp.]|nr:hypothetical protein [Candidatus Contendobacter sp.]
MGTELQLPPSGVFNFTSVNIPSGVTVTFLSNAANTPVVMLVQGDAVIAGTIQVNGGASPPTGRAGDGNLADDGQPGRGGPGGFDGGWGAPPGNQVGSNGLGPGGGSGGDSSDIRLGLCQTPVGGGGGGFGGGGSAGRAGTWGGGNCGRGGAGGSTYGTAGLLPLVGGSGGGGGASWPEYYGSGGGGGGGALLIAVSGKLTLSGTIIANGNIAGQSDLDNSGMGRGGSGSGGAVRLVATTLAGAGSVNALGGKPCSAGSSSCVGQGGYGRVRLEAEIVQHTISSSPGYAFTQTLGPVFLPNMPGLAIISVGGFPVPPQPTGNADVTLPLDVPNPVTIAVESHGVPAGSVVRVRVVPRTGAPVSTDSPPTVGTLETAAATVALNIPEGASVIEAETTFTITAALNQRLAPYAQGEPVERVRLTAEPGRPATMVLLTATGREVEVPAAARAAGW